MSMINIIDEMQQRIGQLTDAIIKHAREFPDEPMEGEYQLWREVGILDRDSFLKLQGQPEIEDNGSE